MGFNFNIYSIMEYRLICNSPWCKATFVVNVEEEQELPKDCPKCRSFDNELSGGVTWTDKKYEGSRFDGQAHPININVLSSSEKKKWW